MPMRPNPDRCDPTRADEACDHAKPIARVATPAPTMTAAELRAALALAEDAERNAELEYRRTDEAEWARYITGPATLEWRATPVPRGHYGSGFGCDNILPEAALVRVEVRMHPNAHRVWCASHEGVPYQWDRRPYATQWHGMAYFRTAEGILYHAGGGSHVLRIPMLCDDDEWARIVAGDPPERFRKGWVRT